MTVPGYHLGEQEQYHHEDPAAARAAELELLKSVDWRSNGYELFSISTFSGANRRGYLQPIMECNCVFSAAENFARIGYADERFQLRGGGSIGSRIRTRTGGRLRMHGNVVVYGDVNGDGSVNWIDLFRIWQSLGPVSAATYAHDPTGDGWVNWLDFWRVLNLPEFGQ